MTTFSKVLPWGRALSEYRAMFALDHLPGDLPGDLAERPYLDVAGGPASFTAEMHAAGAEVVACDPLYEHSAAEIEAGIEEARREIMAVVRANRDRFVWTHLGSPEGMERTRLEAMRRFLEDYEAGRTVGRYRALSLPDLPFDDDSFGLALCSHCLFTYSEQLDLEFHLAALRSLCRVAAEARVFPLLDGAGARSVHVEPLLARLSDEGYRCEVRTVDYEVQRGGTEMLRVRQIS